MALGASLNECVKMTVKGYKWGEVVRRILAKYFDHLDKRALLMRSHFTLSSMETSG